MAPAFRQEDWFSRRAFHWAAFECRHFFQTATMAVRAAEARSEKAPNQLQRNRVSDEDGQTQIVVF